MLQNEKAILGPDSKACASTDSLNRAKSVGGGIKGAPVDGAVLRKVERIFHEANGAHTKLFAIELFLFGGELLVGEFTVIHLDGCTVEFPIICAHQVSCVPGLHIFAKVLLQMVEGNVGDLCEYILKMKIVTFTQGLRNAMHRAFAKTLFDIDEKGEPSVVPFFSTKKR